VFWGVGSYRGNKSSVLATVNEQPIPIDEFLRAYNQRVDSMRRENPNITSEELKRRDFKRQVFSQLVNSKLIVDEAQAMGLTVSPEEVRSEIRQYPAFQNQEKQFDPTRYQAILQSNRLTPVQFESDIRRDLLAQKLVSTIQLPADVTAEQAKEFFKYAREQVKIDYLFYDWKDYRDQVKPAEKEVTTYYKQHKEQFKRPARMKMRYLLITPEAMAAYQEVNATEINKYYEAHKDKFTQQEQVKTRHILVKLGQDASETEIQEAREEIEKIRNEYIQGQNFEELAREYSQGPSAAQGGDLGWVSRGEMVPEFEKTAFELAKGEVSQPVRTKFGFHLIKAEDRKEEGTKPLQEVKPQIRQRIAEDKAADKLGDTLDQALQMVLGGLSLEEAAKEIGLDAQTSSFFTAQNGPQDIDLSKQKISTLFALAPGQTTDSPILLKEGYLLAQKIEEQPAQVRPLEQVRSNIVQTLNKKQAMQLAKKEAQKALEKINSAEELPQKLKQEVKQSEPFGRRGVIPELGMNPELVDDLFAAQNSKWLSQLYEFSSGYAIAKFAEQIPPKTEEWEEQKSFWISTLSRTRKQELFQAYLQDLREKAQIKVLNPEVLSY
jgi:peptidyl-prolyl cis-trans isomerase D